MFTKAFWKGAGERAIKTFFQVAIATIGVSGATVGLQDVNWLSIASIAGVATILSLCTSIANADFTAGVDKNKHL